jgi:hypothetical protein
VAPASHGQTGPRVRYRATDPRRPIRPAPQPAPRT